MSSFTKTNAPNVINLTSGQTFTVKDFRGFTVFEVEENGDFKHKGKQVKT